MDNIINIFRKLLKIRRKLTGETKLLEFKARTFFEKKNGCFDFFLKLLIIIFNVKV